MDVPRLYIENVLWGGCTCVLWWCFGICLAGEHSLIVALLVLKTSDRQVVTHLFAFVLHWSDANRSAFRGNVLAFRYLALFF